MKSNLLKLYCFIFCATVMVSCEKNILIEPESAEILEQTEAKAVLVTVSLILTNGKTEPTQESR